MVKIYSIRILILILINTSILFAKPASVKNEKTIYDTNCVQCHKKLPVTIDKYFYRYLLKYSSENVLKQTMFEYLKNPTKEKTIMSESFITRFGIKKKSKLSDEKLIEAIDIYWEKYKVFGKLK